MAARNDKRRRPAPQPDPKHVETGVNIFVKLGVIGLVAFYVHEGTTDAMAWAFAFGAFFGKEAVDKFIGGKR